MSKNKTKNEILIGQGILECLDKFCCLCGTIGAGERLELRERVRCAWGIFNELGRILMIQRASLRLKGNIYAECVRCLWQ